MWLTFPGPMMLVAPDLIISQLGEHGKKAGTLIFAVSIQK